MRYLSGLSVLTFAFAAAAQDSPTDAESAIPENAQQQVLEELTVTGEKPLGVLRAELEDAEDALYAAFNDAIDDPRFEISCEFVRPIGSLVHRRVCQPGFVREAQYEATHTVRRGISGASDPGLLEFSGNPEAGLAAMHQEMIQLMAETIEENPDLMQIFLHYRETQAALLEAQNE